MSALGAEAPIIAQLKTALGASVKHVCSFASIWGAMSLGPYVPLVAVGPLPDKSLDDPIPHTAAAIEETWQVSLFMPNAQDLTNFAADFSGADAILETIRTALQGWQPAVGYKQMRYLGFAGLGGAPTEPEFQLHFGVTHMEAT